MNNGELTTIQYAKKYGMSQTAVIKRCEEGVIPAYKVGRCWKIKEHQETIVRRDDVDALIRENERLRSVIENINKLSVI